MANEASLTQKIEYERSVGFSLKIVLLIFHKCRLFGFIFFNPPKRGSLRIQNDIVENVLSQILFNGIDKVKRAKSVCFAEFCHHIAYIYFFCLTSLHRLYNSLRQKVWQNTRKYIAGSNHNKVCSLYCFYCSGQIYGAQGTGNRILNTKRLR